MLYIGIGTGEAFNDTMTSWQFVAMYFAGESKWFSTHKIGGVVNLVWFQIVFLFLHLPG